MFERVNTKIIVCLALTSILFAAQYGNSADLVTDAGLKRVFGEASAVVTRIKVAPKLDASLTDEAWSKATRLPLYYADQRVEGGPVRGPWFQLVADDTDLYVAFWATRGSRGSKGKTTDHSSILKDHFVGLTWKTGGAKGPVHFIALEPHGALYHACRSGKDEAWDSSWNPNGVVAVGKKQPKAWVAEFKIPLRLFADKAKGRPQWLPFDIVRNFWSGRKPTKGLERIRSRLAWKQRSEKDVERMLGNMNIYDDQDFGIAYFSDGKHVPSESIRKQIVKATQEAIAEEKIQAAAYSMPQRGFEFSQGELERAYPGNQVLRVPLVKVAPVIDGDPADEAWKVAPKSLMGFLSTEILGRAKRNPTYVQLVSDQKKVYFLFQCGEDELERITATKAEVDRAVDLWREDICDIFLDVGRQRDEASNGFAIIEVNARGTHTHARRRSDTSWDPKGFELKTKLWPKEKKWTLEVALAFSDLGVSPENFPKIWGANFLRSRTTGRGVWIDRSQTKDPAYLNFDFAWRGNLEADPHRPDAFGILYFQAGNALPGKLYDALKKRDAKALGDLKRWVMPKTPAVAVETAKISTKGFVGKPAIRIVDGLASISFEAAVATPVSVAIQNEKGVVVRHLAAGMIGNAAPAPLKPGSLKQNLVWDFKDDAGKPVDPGEYTAILGAGLSVERERFLFHNPNTLRKVEGISVDAMGNIYVLQHDFNGSWHNAPLLLAFDRNGKYVRQLVPYSGKLADQNLVGAKRIELPDGRKIPVVTHAIHQALSPEMVTLSTARFAVAPSGKVIVLNGVRSTATRMPLRLLQVGARGELGQDYLGPVLAPRARMRSQATIALSPDGRYAYVTGIQDGWSNYDGSKRPLKGNIYKHHVVYRLDLTKKIDPSKPLEFPKPFLGKLTNPGEDEARFWKPTGICTDKQGNIYVADCWNDRVLIFTESGKLTGKMNIPGVAQVEVHPKTGAVYALCIQKNKSILRKFENAQATKSVADLDFPVYKWAFLALDSSSEKPRLWLLGQKPGSSRALARGTDAVHAIDDEGKAFKNLGTLISDAGAARPEPGPPGPTLIGARVAPDGKSIGHWSMLLDTSSGKKLQKKAIRMRGLDGRYYAKTGKRGGAGIGRFDATGKALPFKGTAKGLLKPGHGNYEFAVGADGKVFLMQGTGVHVYDTDGKLIQKDFISVPQLPGTSDGVNGTIRVDGKGCVYLSTNMKPADQEIPSDLVGRLPDVGVRPSLPFVYRHLYGSIVKFGPKGGKVVLDKKGDWIWCIYYGGPMRCKAEGVEWVHMGLSPLRYRNVQHIPCSCERANFEVDKFGRVFLPDALKFQCEVLDRKGNTLLRFGRYGNMDDDTELSGDRSNPALAWPVGVQVRGDRLYVTDKLNKRVVKLKLKNTTEEKLKIVVPSL